MDLDIVVSDSVLLREPSNNTFVHIHFKLFVISRSESFHFTSPSCRPPFTGKFDHKASSEEISFVSEDDSINVCNGLWGLYLLNMS